MPESGETGGRERYAHRADPTVIYMARRAEGGYEMETEDGLLLGVLDAGTFESIYEKEVVDDDAGTEGRTGRDAEPQRDGES